MCTKIKIIILISLMLFLGINGTLIYAQEKQEGGLVPVICVYKPLPTHSIKIESSLNIETLWNRPAPEWEISDAGISKGYTYHQGTEADHKWDQSIGQILKLDVGFHPWERITGGFGIEAIGSYADGLWLPINEAHRMSVDKQHVKLVRGELKFEEGKWLLLRYFKGIGHYHWGYEGDMFDLFPESYIPNTYRRIVGKAVPEGSEFVIKGKVNKFTVITGPRLVWGGGESTLVKYNVQISSFNTAMIYKDELIDWAEEDTHMRTGEISTNTEIIKSFPFQVGLLYRPFRVGREYSYLEEVRQGKGYAGSKYIKKTAETNFLDTLAIKMKVNTNKFAPYINSSSLVYTHARLIAGNKNEVTLQLDKDLPGPFYTSGRFTYRKPLIGPMLYLREGTDTNPGPVWSTPRDKDAPFWVNQDNRQATIFSLFFTYDPTPDSWFYQWEPNVIQEWNLNPKDNSKFGFGLGYTLSYFPTTTDVKTYVDSSGKTVWEPSGTHGRWATKKPVSYFTILSKINLSDYRFLVALRAGQELSDGVFPYTTSQEEVKPITGFLNTTVSLARTPFLASVTYQRGTWGPEDWHKTFGQTFDRLLKTSLSVTLGKFDVGVEYLTTREVDTKYITSMIGAFDEIKLYFTWRFDAFLKPPDEE